MGRMGHMGNGEALLRSSGSTCIVVLNNKCNLHCRYCPLIKGQKEIRFDLAASGLRFLLNNNPGTSLLKFSGGEPLLSFSLLKRLVAYGRRRARVLGRSLEFEVTTNGTLMERRHFGYFQKSPDIKLRLSLDGDRETQLINRRSVRDRHDSFEAIYSKRRQWVRLPNLCVNMVIHPNVVHKMARNFLFLLRSGFTVFNFLPAFFIPWNAASVRRLRQQFKDVAFFLKHSPLKNKITIQNRDAWEPDPLFNSGLVIDCNGDVFANNAFLARGYSRLREELRMGRVEELALPGRGRPPRPGHISRLIARHTPAPVLSGTRAANRALNEFVGDITRGTDRY